MAVADVELARHYRDGVGDACLVCDRPLMVLWTDYHGQGRCHECGTTYQILGCHLGAETLQTLGLSAADVARRYCDCFELVPVLRDYWREEHRPVPLGCYLGKSPIPVEDHEMFARWLARNAGRYEQDYRREFEWDMLREKYGK